MSSITTISWENGSGPTIKCIDTSICSEACSLRARDPETGLPILACCLVTLYGPRQLDNTQEVLIQVEQASEGKFVGCGVVIFNKDGRRIVSVNEHDFLDIPIQNP